MFLIYRLDKASAYHFLELFKNTNIVFICVWLFILVFNLR